MISKVMLALFSALTIGSLWMTYSGSGLQGINTHSALKPAKQIRSSHAGSWGYSSGGGFSSGK